MKRQDSHAARAKRDRKSLGEGYAGRSPEPRRSATEVIIQLEEAPALAKTPDGPSKGKKACRKKKKGRGAGLEKEENRKSGLRVLVRGGTGLKRQGPQKAGPGPRAVPSSPVCGAKGRATKNQHKKKFLRSDHWRRNRWRNTRRKIERAEVSGKKGISSSRRKKPRAI